MIKELQDLDEEYVFDLVVAELPTGGAQNANAAESMAIAKTVVACLSTLWDIPLLSVTPSDVKIAGAGKKNASKTEVSNGVAELYPQLRRVYGSARAKSGWNGKFEHVADSIAAFLAVQDDNIIKVMR